jgi:hypothetical protein
MSLNGDSPHTASFSFGPNIGRAYIGSHRDAEGYFNGRIYHVVAGAATISGGDATALRAFLADKSGVTL